MGISRDRWHKKRKTGGRREPIRKKRKFELGRPSANTKLGLKRIHLVRCRGGNLKYRAMRLDQGNFSWASQGIARKTRIIDVKYNSTNNELVRTKTLVKNMIVEIDPSPFRQWYEAHYLLPLGRKKEKSTGKTKEPAPAAPGTEAAADPLTKQRSKKAMKKYEQRQKDMTKLDSLLEEQFGAGRLLACIASRPGQVGRADGYILEGKELEFYSKKLKAKKAK